MSARTLPGALAASGLVLGLALGFGACGDGNDSATSPATTAPEEHRASAAEVVEGVTALRATVAEAAAAVGTDKAKAEAAIEKIEPVWEEIEGTIKANDEDAYLAFEDAFAALARAAQNGDRAKANEAAAEVEAAATKYLADYPG